MSVDEKIDLLRDFANSLADTVEFTTNRNCLTSGRGGGTKYRSGPEAAGRSLGRRRDRLAGFGERGFGGVCAMRCTTASRRFESSSSPNQSSV